MRKLRKMAFLLFIPLVIGLALLFIGIFTGHPKLSDIGISVLTIGFPICMFLTVVIALVFMITGRLQDKPSDTNTATPPASAREKEREKIEDVNSSYGRQSHYKQAEYQMDHVANAYKASPTKDRVLGWLFFGFLMTDFFLILVFAFLHLTVGVIVCFCLFGGTILIALLVKVIVEKSSKHVSKKKLDTLPILHGKVKTCLLSSMSSTGGARRYSTTRIRHVTYRVVIIADGKTYNAYSDDFFETGDEVTFAAKGKLATIIPKEQRPD